MNDKKKGKKSSTKSIKKSVNEKKPKKNRVIRTTKSNS